MSSFPYLPEMVLSFELRAVLVSRECSLFRVTPPLLLSDPPCRLLSPVFARALPRARNDHLPLRTKAPSFFPCPLRPLRLRISLPGSLSRTFPQLPCPRLISLKQDSLRAQFALFSGPLLLSSFFPAPLPRPCFRLTHPPSLSRVPHFPPPNSPHPATLRDNLF